MNHPFPFPFDFPESSNEEVSVSQRAFKNGRIIIATTERLVQFEDVTGTKSYRLTSMATADCECPAALNDLYLCELCVRRIVCHWHAAVCSSCKRTVCDECCRSVINEEQIEERYPPSRILCLQCLEAVFDERTPRIIRWSRRLLDWIRP